MTVKKWFTIKWLFIGLLLIGPAMAHAQWKLTGRITEDSGAEVPGAAVIAYYAQELAPIAYTVSDISGFFQLSLPDSGTYRIEVAHLSFEKESRTVFIGQTSLESLNMVLKEKTEQLEEVEVSAESLDALIRKDTVTYKIERFTTGTETNLKDILEKLPGLEIDEQGKIRAFGKKIDKLLIDGEEFFDDLHQLATENIAAEMVQDVQLLNNYQEFDALKDYGSQRQTALNVNIKEEFKGRFTGNATASYGYNQRLLAHLNVFKFSQKFKFSNITDANNLGNQPLTFQDYVDMNGGMQEYVKNNGVNGLLITDDENLPDFLKSDTDVKRRMGYFNATNFVYKPTAKFKLEGFAILDQSYISQKEKELQKYWTEDGFREIRNDLSSHGSFFAGTSQVEAKYKYDERTMINYTIRYNPQSDHKNPEGVNWVDSVSNRFYQRQHNQGQSLGQQLSVLRSLGQQTLLTINAFHDLRQNTRRLQVRTDEPFFSALLSDTAFVQHTRENGHQQGYSLKVDHHAGEHVWAVSLGTTLGSQQFQSDLQHSATFSNDLLLKRQDYYATTSYAYKHGIWHYSMELGYHYFRFHQQDRRQELVMLFPKFGWIARFSTTHFLSFNYSYNTEFAGAHELLTGQVVKDFRSVLSDRDVQYDSRLPVHHLGITYFLLDFFSGTTLTSSVNYTYQNRYIAQDVTYQDQASFFAYRLAPDNSTLTSMVALDKKLKKAAGAISYQWMMTNTWSQTFVSSIPMAFESLLLTNQIKWRSRFHSEKFNFQTGVKNIRNQLRFESVSGENRLDVWQAELTLSGKFSSGISYEMGGSYTNMVSGAYHVSIWALNPALIYRAPGQSWSWAIRGKNVCNMNQLRRVTVNNTSNYFDQSEVYAIPGYMILEIKHFF